MVQMVIVVGAVAAACVAAVSWTVRQYRCLRRRESACRGCRLKEMCKKPRDL